jgi:flagellin-like protein
MQFRKLLHDEDAVSPVIGVILMVAITVILAAVIASFVLGLGDTSDPAPSTSFEWNYDTGDKTLEMVHDGGDEFNSDQVSIAGSNIGCEGDTWTDVSPGSSTTDVSAGDRAVIDLDATGDGDTNCDTTNPDQYEIELVWEAEGGDTTDTIGKDSGPDA